MGGVEHKFFMRQVPRWIGPIFGWESRSFVHLGIAAAVWIVATAVAVLFASRSRWVAKFTSNATSSARRKAQHPLGDDVALDLRGTP